jgi:putative tricarboxylic transport membrane protein
MLAGFGRHGFLMRRFDYPVAPMVVGLILARGREPTPPRAADQSSAIRWCCCRARMSGDAARRGAARAHCAVALKGLDRFKASED